MENTIMEAAQNKEVAPVIERAAKNSVNGGIVALGTLVVAGIGYLAWKGVETMKAANEAKKAEEEAKAQEHEFYVANP